MSRNSAIEEINVDSTNGVYKRNRGMVSMREEVTNVDEFELSRM